ncbi:MAG TPA: ATP synthase F0 subunit B [Thermoanaerobaculia bacterium]|nr:ATP synthase F0 subunit B [Thermoanaerobaculia bacterium]
MIAAVLLLLEEGSERGFLGVPSLVWQVANLAAFLALLWYFLRRPVSEFFGSRRNEVASALAKAEEDRRRAEALAAELERRLREIDTELANLKAAAKRDAETEHAEVLKRTEADAARVLERAKTDVDNRVRAARVELTAFAGDLAVEVAREILAKSVTPEDEARLAKAGVADLARARG